MLRMIINLDRSKDRWQQLLASHEEWGRMRITPSISEDL